MYKGKIKTHCGNEFTVFFLKDNNFYHSKSSASLKHKKYLTTESNLDNLNWMDVNENSAGGFSNHFKNN